MSKNTKVSVARVNEIQLATYNALVAGSVDGVIPGAHADTFKQNVVSALIRAGALKNFRRNDLKTVDGVEVELLVRKPQARTLAKLAGAEQEMAIAA